MEQDTIAERCRTLIHLLTLISDADEETNAPDRLKSQSILDLARICRDIATEIEEIKKHI